MRAHRDCQPAEARVLIEQSLVDAASQPETIEIASEEMIREALCFGWVDSFVNRLDMMKLVKVTPRRLGFGKARASRLLVDVVSRTRTSTSRTPVFFETWARQFSSALPNAHDERTALNPRHFIAGQSWCIGMDVHRDAERWKRVVADWISSPSATAGSPSRTRIARIDRRCDFSPVHYCRFRRRIIGVCQARPGDPGKRAA
jgi:hypothetical protein